MLKLITAILYYDAISLFAVLKAAIQACSHLLITFPFTILNFSASFDEGDIRTSFILFNVSIFLIFILRAYSWTTKYHIGTILKATEEPEEIKVPPSAYYGFG
jgi:hypothetical protein